MARSLGQYGRAPVPRVDGPSITYQFQIIEVNGLQWREGTIQGLKPVSSHGGVTVWTAPADFLKQLPAGAGKQGPHGAQSSRHTPRPPRTSRPEGTTRS